MKYSEAKRIGIGCGLEHPAEFVNNIVFHAMNIMIYDEIEEELAELRADAIEHGVQFSNKCGCAVLEGNSKDEYCCNCKKIQALKNKEQENDE